MFFDSLDIYTAPFYCFSIYFLILSILFVFCQFVYSRNRNLLKTKFRPIMLIITFMVWGIGLFSAGKEYLSKKNFLDDLKGGNFSTAVGYITEIENDISVDNYSFKFEPLEGKNLDFTIKDKDAWRYIHADENLQQIVYTGDKIHFVDYFTLSEYESLSYSQVKQYISEKFIKEILSNKLTTDSFTESENYNRSEVTVAIGILFFLLGFYFLISNIRDERIIKKRLAQLDRANQQNNN